MEAVPAVHDFLTNNFVRGAISGLGVLNILAAVAELVDVLGWHRGESAPPAGPFGEHGAR